MWQQFEIRQRDRLPAFAATLLDNAGTAITLDRDVQRAYISIVHQRLGTEFYTEASIDGTIPGTVVYDWQEGDTDLLPVGVYDVSIEVTRRDTGDTDQIAPTRRNALLVVRPAAPLGEVEPPDTEPVYWDEPGDVTRWDDPSNNIRWRP